MIQRQREILKELHWLEQKLPPVLPFRITNELQKTNFGTIALDQTRLKNLVDATVWVQNDSNEKQGESRRRRTVAEPAMRTWIRRKEILNTDNTWKST
jgi:hypothetical protein